MSKRRTAEDIRRMYAEDPVLSAAHRILWEDWDPIGTEGLPEDEYETYEREVIRMIVGGKTASQIATYLFISEYGMFHDEEETRRQAAHPAVPYDAVQRLMPVARRLLSLYTKTLL
jgi:hypothetical protein